MIAFHYSTIKDMFGGCPMVVAIGESETGKFTAIQAALSLFGCNQISRYVDALFMERAVALFCLVLKRLFLPKKGEQTNLI